ncbi:MAG: RteC domain-containing protein [Prolixibacteraceae bacterium]|nr:RteC domain-containing protein [Prolixibacteraceae bacterium]
MEFFRTLKPQIYSKLLYYACLLNIGSKRLGGCSKVERKYLVN